MGIVQNTMGIMGWGGVGGDSEGIKSKFLNWWLFM